MRNLKLIDHNEFENIVHDLIANETVLKMKNFTQHLGTCRFEHCYSVAYYSYWVCKKLKLDYISATRAGMLHDLFFYNCKDKNCNKRFHAIHHGKIACQNASKLFDLSQKEKDMISRHMWPVTFAFPTSIEGFILTCIDKYCATLEFWNALKYFTYSKKYFRYAYLFLGLFLFNIRYI